MREGESEGTGKRGSRGRQETRSDGKEQQAITGGGGTEAVNAD